jgi:hypothetical protein
MTITATGNPDAPARTLPAGMTLSLNVYAMSSYGSPAHVTYIHRTPINDDGFGQDEADRILSELPNLGTDESPTVWRPMTDDEIIEFMDTGE